ncbi:alpha/beta fold hydrolase [Chloroflexota bacterium]
MLKKYPRFKRISILLLTVILALVVILTAVFLRWRHVEQLRLLNGSQLIETSQGLMEFAAFGEGPAVLVLHGTIGGYDQAVTLAEMVDTHAYQFISVSRPGYLQTPLSTGLSLSEQADAYAALLDELGIDQVAILAISGGVLQL